MRIAQTHAPGGKFHGSRAVLITPHSHPTEASIAGAEHCDRSTCRAPSTNRILDSPSPSLRPIARRPKHRPIVSEVLANTSRSRRRRLRPRCHRSRRSVFFSEVYECRATPDIDILAAVASAVPIAGAPSSSLRPTIAEQRPTSASYRRPYAGGEGNPQTNRQAVSTKPFYCTNTNMHYHR